MLRTRLQFAFAIVLVGSLWVPVGSKAQEAGKPQGQESPTGTSFDPAAMFKRLSAGQVVVTYENGELTILAKNVSLKRILQDICTRMGASLDFSPEVADESVFVALGPAPAKEVINSLLAGSQLNYALARPADAPNELATLTVVPKGMDPVARPSRAQQQTAERNAGSKPAALPTPPEKNSALDQLRELAAAAKAQSGGGGVVQIEMGTADSDNPAEAITTNLNVDDILNQLEAQVKAASQNPQPQRTAAATTDNPAADPNASDPPSSPVTIPRRHRRH